ncbi:MAG: hypothetical protein M3401_10785 [Actinomycetota bacterium]|nr:hypothetical protein [Actinomycetota bacterium]
MRSWPGRMTPRRRRTSLLALVICMLVAAIGAQPACARTLQKGFWGPTEIAGVSQFPLYERLGVTLYQTTLSWASIAPTRPADPKDPSDPAYRWPDEIDRVIAEARGHRIGVLLMLFGAPPWANGGRSQEYAPRRTADFAAFARAAARRYPAVRRWMIWGEPSRSHNFKPLAKQPLGKPITRRQARAPRRYARLLDAAYGQLKAQRRSNLVIGGNTYTTGEIRPADWVRNMRLKNGRPARMDLYGHNPFSFRNPDLRNPRSSSVDLSDLDWFSELVQRRLGRPRHTRVRLFLSEFTMPTAPDREFNLYVTPATQAKWITKAFRIARAVKADGLGWIHLRDEPPDGDERVVNGGLLTHDGRRKPGFYAFMRGGLTAAQRAREHRRW